MQNSSVLLNILAGSTRDLQQCATFEILIFKLSNYS